MNIGLAKSLQVRFKRNEQSINTRLVELFSVFNYTKDHLAVVELEARNSLESFTGRC